MNEAFIIDVVVIALLGSTIYFAFRLDRRLQGMRNVQSDIAGVIRELNAAAARAEAGIQGLKSAAESTGQELEETIKHAQGIGDELAVLMKASERAGRQLEPPRAPVNVATKFTSRPALDALRARSVNG